MDNCQHNGTCIHYYQRLNNQAVDIEALQQAYQQGYDYGWKIGYFIGINNK